MENSITVEGLRTLKYYHFVMQWGKRVMLPIFEYNFLHGTGKTIFEVLKDVGVNLGGRRSLFNKGEVNKITSNVPPDTLDITLLYKIFTVLWGHYFKVPSEALKDCMQNIKDERNRVAHEERAITHAELEVKLDDFGQVLETALDEAQAHYSHLGANFDSIKIEIRSDIPKIKEKIREKYDPAAQHDVARFQNEIGEFIDCLNGFFHSKLKNPLKVVYSSECKILPFEWLRQYDLAYPSEIHVPLKMRIDQKFNPRFQDKDLITLDQKDILNLKDPSNRDPEVIILSGNAGSGKTTVLSSIVENWYKDASDIPLLSTYQTLLYMQFRSHDHNNFDGYLEDLLPVTVPNCGIDNVKASILNSNCLVVCDAYDEGNDNSKKLFESLLKLKYKKIKMIVTSRPSSVNELIRVIHQTKRTRIILNMLGVADQNVELHIKKVIGYLHVRSDGEERQKIENKIIKVFKTMDDNLLEVLKNPLWLNLFILLQSECPAKRGNYHSATSLYEELTENRRQRIVSNESNPDLAMEKVLKFEEFYNKWSFKYYQMKKYELSQEDVKVFQDKCKDLCLCSDSIMSSFFNIKHTQKRLIVTPVYCFLHRTDQEYAAAAYLADIIKKFYEKDKTLVENLKKCGENVIHHALKSAGLMKEKQEESDELVDILVFITGILYNTEASVFTHVIDDIIDLHWMWRGQDFTSKGDEIEIDFLTVHCVETNNDQRVIEAIKRKLDNGKTLTTERSDRLQCFLSITQGVKPGGVNINISSPVSERGLRRLQNSLLELHRKQKASGFHFEVPNSVHKFRLRLATPLPMKEANLQILSSILKLLIPKGMSYRTANLHIVEDEDSIHWINLVLSNENSPVIGMESPTVNFKIKLESTFDDENYSLASLNKLANALLPVDKKCDLKVVSRIMVYSPKTETDQRVCNSGQIAVGHSSPEDQQGCSQQTTTVSPLELVIIPKSIEFNFIAKFDEWNDSNVRRLGMMINALWPRQMQYHEGIVGIDSWEKNITKKAIKQLGELLTIKPGVGIYIFLATEDAFEAREELSAFYEEKGYKLERISMEPDYDDENDDIT